MPHIGKFIHGEEEWRKVEGESKGMKDEIVMLTGCEVGVGRVFVVVVEYCYGSFNVLPTSLAKG
jgi:hypothetical protein